MSTSSLQKLLKQDSRRIVRTLLDMQPVPMAILDSNEQRLLGNSLDIPENSGSVPIAIRGYQAGWVVGPEGSEAQARVAKMMGLIIEQALEKKDLAAEVLERYRELNLVYRLSARLMTSLHPETIAKMALEEICPLAQINAGVVLLFGRKDHQLTQAAACGEPIPIQPERWQGVEVVERTLQTGSAEIANSLPSSLLWDASGEKNLSLLCAPLKTEKQVIGAIVLVKYPAGEFSAGDLKLVGAIGMQTAPAIENAYLHQASLETARLEHDLQTARKVQADLLPRQMPHLDGWRLSAYWQPARMVSGDFYDFVPLGGKRLAIVIGDVTDKGMPAALVMANTRSILRAVIAGTGRSRRDTPGAMLARANNLLVDDMPQHMFVTCFLAILDPPEGRLDYSNAGHPLPFHGQKREIQPLSATGLPLGIFPNVTYDDKSLQIDPGDRLFLYSDGLIEAHNPKGEMFGTDRVCQILAESPGWLDMDGEALIQAMAGHLAEFTRPGWEQEDDVTMVVLESLL